MSLGERIKKIRTKAGLSQSEMANMLDMGQSSYSKYEKNQTEPTVKKLIKISEIGKVSTDWLLKGEEISSAEIRNLVQPELLESAIKLVESLNEKEILNPEKKAEAIVKIYLDKLKDKEKSEG